MYTIQILPRYVVLLHELDHQHSINSVDVRPLDGRTDHWDLMLELDGVLKTWEVLFLPKCGSNGMVQRLPDHRLHYLDYEGEISNNRGKVTRVCSGSIEWIHHSATLFHGLLSGDVEGQIELRLLKTAEGGKRGDEQWALTIN